MRYSVSKSRFGIHKQLSVLLTCIILSTTFQALESQWSEGNHLLCNDKFQIAEIVIAIHFFSIPSVTSYFQWIILRHVICSNFSCVYIAFYIIVGILSFLFWLLCCLHFCHLRFCYPFGVLKVVVTRV